jgi:hypothetical protein
MARGDKSFDITVTDSGDLHHCFPSSVLADCIYSASFRFRFRPMIPVVGADMILKRRRNHGGNCSSETC